MQIGSGEFTFEWIEDFAEIPCPAEAARGWAHHDIACTANGTLLTFHPARPTLLELTTDGGLVRSVEVPITEAHGITVCPGGSSAGVWLADNGRKRQPARDYNYVRGRKGGHVLRMSLSGEVAMELHAPRLPIYDSGTFSPTQVAIWRSVDGGGDDVWVADGYGQNQVHRFSSSGEYVSSISGSEGNAGAFRTPHAIWIDTRKNDAELYVADRASGQIQVYSADGEFKRSFGKEYMITPTAFARYGDFLIVAELSARIMILDGDDRLVTYLGDNHGVAAERGWPNVLNEQGVPTRSNRLRAGFFNSPHGVAADEAGNIFVSEWLIGGRYIKLARAR